MIHLRLNFNEQMKAWLKEVTETENKFCYVALRKVAEQWNRPYLELLSKGELRIEDKKITLQEVVDNEEELKDEDEGELIIGEVMAEKLKDAYSILKVVYPQIITVNINDWCREVINENIINEKDKWDREKLKEEEEEI